MTIVALVILAVLMPPVVFDLVRRPTIRRLGLRNVSRRRGEAALVVGGSLLATALVTAAFVVGDSFGGSIRSLAETRWGPTDMLVSGDDINTEQAAQLISDLDSPNIDGVMPVSFVAVAIGAGDVAESNRAVEPRVRLLEFDPAIGATFGGDESATGLADAPNQLAADEIIINDVLAEDLGASVGDPIEIFIGDGEIVFEVAAIVEKTGLAGIGEAIVLPGAVTESPLAQTEAAASVVQTAVFVSNTGDVYAGADLSRVVEDEIRAAMAGNSITDVEIERVKEWLLEDAEFESADTTSLFGTIGGFSVAAGILLVINLFVMLAAERTVELGTMRAVGMRRGAIMRSFALEGAVYGLIAAVSGALVGVGVGAAVTAYASAVLPSDDVSISLFVEPSSLVSGAVIGLAISQLTVVLTSFRTSKLNIIRALKDMPAQTSRERSWKSLVGGAVGVVGGIALYLLAGTTPVVAMIAPVLALIAAIPLLGRVIPPRLAIVVLCGAALFWTAAVFGLLPEVMDDPDISLFLVQGILLVGLAVTMAAVLEGFWSRLARLGGGANVAARLGLAHPLDRPVRSALLVAMYALVIFTVTFMGVMNSVFSASTPELAQQAAGEWAVLVDTNETSTFSADELAARDDVAHVVPLRTSGVEVAGTTATFDDEDVTGDDEAETYFTRAQFIDERFLAVAPPALTQRNDAFADDAAAWRALTEGTDADGNAWVVVQDWSGEVPGDVITLRTTEGNDVGVRVAGVMANGWLIGSGMYLGEPMAPTLLDQIAAPWRHLAVPAEGTSASVLAATLNADGVERGADSVAVLDLAINETSEQEAFISMLQGYLGLGLLIGIAGLGVVLVRAVRERRRQLGMLRAVGIRAQTVRGSFMVEAAFIGFQGVALGIGLGVLSSWQTLTRSTAFEEGLTFALPYRWLATLAVIALAASLLAALAPAVRAGRVPPASALRMTS